MDSKFESVEQQAQDLREQERKTVLEKTIAVLHEEFKNTATEVYLVGSLTRPYAFTSTSDVDIVVKNFTGDRFDLWTHLEDKIGRCVEIIPFEKCHFQEFILQQGLKVI